jgi:hypothetical protein
LVEGDVDVTTAILYAFDLIEHDGEDLRGLPFLDRKAAMAQLPGFTGELLGELGKCDAADLLRLFGPPIRSPRPRATSPEAPAPQAADQQTATAGALSVDEADPAALRPPIVEPPGVTLLNAYPAEPQWDEHGYRIGPKLPSAFPRCYEPPRPRGTHWSR